MRSWLTVCVYLPHLLADVARRRQPAPAPLAVAAACSDRAPVVDRCDRAAQAGVQPGMPVLIARQRCRNLEVVVPDRVAIAAVVDGVDVILREQGEDARRVAAGRWTARLVALGTSYHAAAPLAEALRAAIVSATGVRCQLGLARETTIATIAARAAGGVGVRVVLPDTEAAFLAPLSIDQLPGLGAQTQAELARLGVTRIEQLRQIPLALLEQLCGARAGALMRYARGSPAGEHTARPVLTASWHAAEEPVSDRRTLRARVHVLTAQLGRELRARDEAAGELGVTLVWADGARSARHQRDRARRDLDAGLHAWSEAALRALLAERRLAVRGLGVTLGDLGPRQAGLFAGDDERPRRLQQALDLLARRYGPAVVLPGDLIGLAASRP